jgi:hypothetical protein
MAIYSTTTKTYIKDNKNNVLGWLVESNDEICVYDRGNNYKGKYKKATNYTYDRGLNSVGVGNLTASLLFR